MVHSGGSLRDDEYGYGSVDGYGPLLKRPSARERARKAGFVFLSISLFCLALAATILVASSTPSSVDANDIVEIPQFEELKTSKAMLINKAAALRAKKHTGGQDAVELALRRQLSRSVHSREHNMFETSVKKQGAAILEKVQKEGALGEHAKLKPKKMRRSHLRSGSVDSLASAGSQTVTEAALEKKLDLSALKKQKELLHVQLVSQQTGQVTDSDTSKEGTAEQSTNARKVKKAALKKKVKLMEQVPSSHEAQDKLRKVLDKAAARKKRAMFSKQAAQFDMPTKARSASPAAKRVALKTAELMKHTLDQSRQDHPDLAKDTDGIKNPVKRKSFKSWLSGFRAKLEEHTEKRGAQLLNQAKSQPGQHTNQEAAQKFAIP